MVAGPAPDAHAANHRDKVADRSGPEVLESGTDPLGRDTRPAHGGKHERLRQSHEGNGGLVRPAEGSDVTTGAPLTSGLPGRRRP